ncbi:hypothetical protein MRX96_020708 [Rhipicephalus microplus]
MVRSSIFLDRYCLAHLSWEDIEALMLREKELPRRRVHASRGGLLNSDSMSSQCFRRQFRFEKADFPVLVLAPKMLQYTTSAQRNFGCFLNKMNIHLWLKHSDLEAMSEAVHSKGAPLRNCWAFIDGTARPHMPTLARSAPLDGPYPRRRHDPGILRDSQLYKKLEALALDKEFLIYGDPA